MKEKRYICRGILLMAIGVISACSNETDAPIDAESVTEAVDFTGAVRGKSVQTRAGEEDEVWLEMPFDTWKWNDTPIDFYIHQQVDNTTNTATYLLRQGEIGRLEYSTGNEGKPLSWVSSGAKHTFHVWTKPEGVEMADGNATGTVKIGTRNQDYEYFVGATAGPMSYGTHGVTVGLPFEHLVGKIVIEKMSLIMSDGSINENIWNQLRSISFPNMPATGKFITGIGDNANVMKVEPDGSKEGVTFSAADYSGHFEKEKNIPLYVLPQSFNDGHNFGEFFVILNHAEGLRMYKGNLNELVNEDAEDNLTGINAGECLRLRLVLKDDEVKGFYVYINNWNTAEAESVKDKPYPGISSAEDIVNIVEWVGESEFNLNLEDLVYEEDKDGVKIVRLCDNIDLSAYPGITLVIPEGYKLDGCGFNINCPGLVLEGVTENLFVNGKSHSNT